MLLPKVSLITSWYEIAEQEKPGANLHGISLALQEGVEDLDLYFLNHMDIQWYASAIGRTPPAPRDCEPHQFAASLKPNDITMLAAKLKAPIQASGRSRKPHFASIATFFPNLSLPDFEDPNHKRKQAVAAVKNALLLARLLECSCVEIVGGAGVPGAHFTNHYSPVEYREARRMALATSIKEVFNSMPFKGKKALKSLPNLAIELEPGPSFLLNHLDEFRLLREHLHNDELAYAHLKLNIDIAHAFLLGYTTKDLGDLKNEVAHMHISDHAGHHLAGGIHESDVLPGTFHTYDSFEIWLRFAIELSNLRIPAGPGPFSRYIAIEMESSNDIDKTLAAVNMTRRWIAQAARGLSATA